MPTFVVDTNRAPVDLLAVKLRERSMDSILYTLPGHTVDSPQTITISSTLPTPRKGNPGTVKTSVNVRQTVILDEGKSTERNVPVITKLETSFPVGCTTTERRNILLALGAVIQQSNVEMDKLFYNGILPND